MRQRHDRLRLAAFLLGHEQEAVAFDELSLGRLLPLADPVPSAARGTLAYDDWLFRTVLPNQPFLFGSDLPTLPDLPPVPDVLHVCGTIGCSLQAADPPSSTLSSPPSLRGLGPPLSDGARDEIRRLREAAVRPAFVANDFLARLAQNLPSSSLAAALVTEWPRLLVATRDPTPLRVAPFGLHCALIAVHGELRARLFPHDQLHLLYPARDGSLPADLDVFDLDNPAQRADARLRYPAAMLARHWDATVRAPSSSPSPPSPLSPQRSHTSPLCVRLSASQLAPGSVLFVPSGTAASLRAISGAASFTEHCFMDATNLNLVRTELAHAAHRSEIKRSLLRSLLPGGSLLDCSMDRDPQDLPASSAPLFVPPSAGPASDRGRRLRLRQEERAWSTKIHQLTTPLPEDVLVRDATRTSLSLTWTLPFDSADAKQLATAASNAVANEAGAQRALAHPFTGFLVVWSAHHLDPTDSLVCEAGRCAHLRAPAFFDPVFAAPHHVGEAVEENLFANETALDLVAAAAETIELDALTPLPDPGLVSVPPLQRQRIERLRRTLELSPDAVSDWDVPADIDEVLLSNRTRADLVDHILLHARPGTSDVELARARQSLAGFAVRDARFVPVASDPIHDVAAGARLTLELHDLHPDTQYTFRVAAVGVAGLSAFGRPSLPVRTLPRTPPSAPPGPPVVERVERTAIALSWSPPENHGGLPILAYAVAQVPGGLSSAPHAPLVVPASTAATIARLPPLSLTRFSVAAINRLGVGPWSPASAPARTVGPPALASETHPLGDHERFTEADAPSDPAWALLVQAAQLVVSNASALQLNASSASIDAILLRSKWSLEATRAVPIMSPPPDPGHTPAATPSPTIALVPEVAHLPEPCLGPVAVLSARFAKLRVELEPRAPEFIGWASHFSPLHFDVTGELVASVPLGGNHLSRPGNPFDPLNPHAFRDRIVVFLRGFAPLATKIARAAEAGAVGVIIIDHQGQCDNEQFTQNCVLGADKRRKERFAAEDPPGPWERARIPALLVSRYSGVEILRLMGLGESFPVELRGAASQRRTRRNLHPDTA